VLAYPDPPLVGDGFVLRPFHAGDDAAARAFAEDPDTARWVPPLPADDGHGVVLRFERFRTDGDLLHLVVADTTDDTYLGEVMLAVGEDDVVEVGCGVVPAHRGRGLATAALRLFDRWCVDRLAVPRIQVLVAVANRPGLELAVRCGFRREGVLRSHWSDEGGGRLDVVVLAMLPREVPAP